MTFKYLAAFAILLTSTLVLQAQKPDKDETAVRTAMSAMTTAQSAYDAAELDQLFTNDYIEISPAGEYDARAKVLSFYTLTEKEKAAGISVDVAEDFRSIRIYGKTAVAIVELTFSMVKDGKALPTRKMMAMAVCRKESGVWKIASVQYTGIRQPPTPAATPK